MLIFKALVVVYIKSFFMDYFFFATDFNQSYQACLISDQLLKDEEMKIDSLLSSVDNNLIKFGTTRKLDSRFITIERQVIIIAPLDLVNLSKIGKLIVLEKLIELLKYPNRAWAAEVLLAAMTQQETKIIEIYANRTDEWWNDLGTTAYERWSNWLKNTRSRLVWDSKDKVFIEIKNSE